ncbi:hypothetical protein ACTFIU_005478 [Dictyostelium citrinum]
MNDIEIINNNSLLFFKIWRNCVIKNTILKHLMMFNLFSFHVEKDSSQQQQFIIDNKEYIKSLIITFDQTVVDIDRNQKNQGTFEIEEKLNSLPNNIVSLQLDQANGINYDLPTTTTTTIPNSIKHLKLHEYFNQPLSKENSKIFSNLVTLEFGFFFNETIDANIFPNSLKQIKFGSFFNQSINDNVFPNSLEKVEFGSYFNQKLDNLPQSIKEIKFVSNSKFDIEINSKKLPSSLTKLTLPRFYDISLIRGGILPNQLVELKLSNSTIYNNRKQKHLKLNVYNANGNLSNTQEILKLFDGNSKIIPPSVTNLTIFYYINSEAQCTSFSESSIQFSSQFCSLNLNTTTPNLQYYWIYHESSKSLLKRFEKVKSLRLNLIENNFILDHLSNTCLSHLIKLDLKEYNYKSYIKPIKDFKVFSKLKCLKLGNYNSTLSSKTFPPSLELLELGYEFKQPIHKKWLPISIKHIIVLNENTPIHSLPDTLESIWILQNHYQLKDFNFFIPLFGKLKIVDQDVIYKAFNKIFKKNYEISFY